ncbi:MAG: hypothetical protein ACJAU0_000538 [Flavobacteriales bacterium]|jgi:hypothetical protein
MKKSIFSAAALVVVLLGSAFMVGNGELESLEIGAKAPMADVKMAGIDGNAHTLESLAGENGLLVVFSCNTCPFVVGREGKSEGWEGRYNDVYKSATKAGFGMVLVNSNEAKRSGDDSMDEMKMHARSAAYAMPYVVDQDHRLADAMGARTTPHVYLFDKDMTLVYKGAIDDNFESAKEVQEPWLKNAMTSCADGTTIEMNSTRPMGCSIKRVAK